MENNKVTLLGKVANRPEHLFTTRSGEKHYTTEVETERYSKTVDTIPVIFNEEHLQAFIDAFENEQPIFIEGYYRSRNEEIDGKHRLLLSVYAEYAEMTDPENKHVDDIELTGFVVKTPSYRQTPKKRSICDLMLAVNRDSFSKSDYIPCIVWGKLADVAKDYEVGTKVKLEGRIQSRIYSKEIDGKTEERIAYEVSANKITKEN